MLLYLEMEDYLAQWFVNDMGGGQPVKLRRGCAEWELLETYLRKPPAGERPDLGGPGRLAIELPQFRLKNPTFYHWLAPHARRLLRHCIQTRFDVEMWRELNRFDNLFRQTDELVWAFMEAHGIELEERNWNTIAKRYRRKRDIYRRVESRKVQKNHTDAEVENWQMSDLSDLSGL